MFGSNKKQGFHITIELRDRSFDLSVYLKKDRKFSIFCEVSVAHNLEPENGFDDEDMKQFASILNKSFIKLGDATVTKLPQGKKIVIESAKCIIFPPWFFVDELVNIPLTKTNEALILTKRHIIDSLKRTDFALLSPESKVSAYGYKKSVLETLVENIYMNGYKIPHPLGKKSKNITIDASMYTVAAQILDSLNGEMRFHLNKDPKIITLPKMLVEYVGLRHVSLPATYIALERKLTSIIQIHSVEPDVYNFHTINMGTDTILELIMNKLGVSRELAISYLKMNADKTLSDDIAKSLNDELSLFWDKWKAEVGIFIAKYGSSAVSRELLFRESFLPTLLAIGFPFKLRKISNAIIGVIG
jgi:hypothetical protein